MARINAFEPAVQALSDEQLRGRTVEFRERLQQRLEGSADLAPEARKLLEQEALDELLPEAFACVREASIRTTGMRHFDVQLIGGMVLHRGMIAEMKTGEGKTLVATLPVYLNALLGKGAHVVTVNDYLAGRDAEWMGKIYRFLGLEVGCIQNDMETSNAERPTKPTSPTAPTTSSARLPARQHEVRCRDPCNAATISELLTKSTRF